MLRYIRKKRKKITALGCAVCAISAFGLVGSSQIGAISFWEGSVWGIICAISALVLQSLGK